VVSEIVVVAFVVSEIVVVAVVVAFPVVAAVDVAAVVVAAGVVVVVVEVALLVVVTLVALAPVVVAADVVVEVMVVLAAVAVVLVAVETTLPLPGGKYMSRLLPLSATNRAPELSSATAVGPCRAVAEAPLVVLVRSICPHTLVAAFLPGGKYRRRLLPVSAT